MSDKYELCPLTAAGLALVTFAELPALVIGPDGKCICAKNQPCMDVDKRDGQRCTLEQLRQLDAAARRRRACQSG